MATIQLIEKSTGQLTDASGKNMLSLVHPCVVKVSASLGYLKSISRNGESLVVHLKSGEVVTIDNFFHDVDGVRNDLVLEEPSNRQLWWANYSDPWDGVELLELGSIDELLIEQSDDLLDLLLLGVGLGAIGLVSGGGHQGAGYGLRATRKTAAGAASFRSGQPVRQPPVSAAVVAISDGTEHEPSR